MDSFSKRRVVISKLRASNWLMMQPRIVSRKDCMCCRAWPTKPAWSKLARVDVIVLLDVIEHLPQPRETLDLCSRHLNPGGLIVISTGDFASMAAKLSGPKWRLMTPPQHLWYFTPDSMRRMAAGLGLLSRASRSPLEDRAGLPDPVPTPTNVRHRRRSGHCRQFDRGPREPVRRHAYCAPETPMSHDRLALSQVALLVAYAAGMAGGQMLFKAAALRYQPDGTAAERAFSLVFNVYFLGAVALYVALTVLWVWLLTFIPLSRAYPFVALAFAITPLLGGMMFAEPITVKLLAGIALLLGGLLLIAS